MPVLTLYTRHGCHLCEDMEQQLMRLKQELDLVWVCVDIDADESLRQQYNEWVPVLMGQSGEICHHFLDEVALRDYLHFPTGF
ncbi:MAG: glutaredoxin family protein [Gammaproteobacteria bacterium]|nr:glutaredoxin family protein [Gammaproteobacteria bacterium]